MSDSEVNGSEVVLAEDKPAEDRTYTSAEVAKIVQDRLKRVKVPEKAVDENVVVDLKNKLTTYEQATQALTDKLTRMGQRAVKAHVEARLAEAGCLDPELVAESFLTKGLVSPGDDDQPKVSNANNDLGELIQSTLAAKPWLVRPSGPGLGSRSPKVPESETNDLSRMSVEQIMARIGPPKGKSFLDK